MGIQISNSNRLTGSPRDYAPALLRLSLVGVFLWFGISQLNNPEGWVSFVPEWIISASGLDAAFIVTLSGAFQVLGAMILAVGFFIKSISFLLAVHLVIFSFELLPEGVAIRDLGLASATIAVGLYGRDILCLSRRNSDD